MIRRARIDSAMLGWLLAGLSSAERAFELVEVRCDVGDRAEPKPLRQSGRELNESSATAYFRTW